MKILMRFNIFDFFEYLMNYEREIKDAERSGNKTRIKRG